MMTSYCDILKCEYKKYKFFLYKYGDLEMFTHRSRSTEFADNNDIKNQIVNVWRIKGFILPEFKTLFM